MLSIRDLHFSYGNGSEVLKGIDLDLSTGDLLGIIGPNGSGKSTLLGCMSGVRPIERNRVYLKGRDIRELRRRDIARIMAVLPQERAVGFDFRVNEIVSMGRYPYMGRFEFGGTEHEAVVEKAMKYADVWKFRDKRFSNLSGGEKQRVNIARSLAQEPELLLLDEPTKDLDIRHALDILGLVESKNRDEGLTVAVVLHDLNLAARFCRRIAVMKEGRLVSAGEPREILTSRMIRDVFGVRARVTGKGKVRVDVYG
ncbi:MAG: ABC transporter ATP-binding protein [Thermoplasmatota archaeon]